SLAAFAAFFDACVAACFARDSDLAVSVTLLVVVVVLVDDAAGNSVLVVASTGLFNACKYL
ncbi:hypothetical protein L9G16_23115, partial [Shewanella sp. A25]|nr:hypothetical protein [Shewanella shenzhenensis]